MPACCLSACQLKLLVISLNASEIRAPKLIRTLQELPGQWGGLLLPWLRWAMVYGAYALHIAYRITHREQAHAKPAVCLLFVLPGLLQSASRLCPLGLSLRPMAAASSRTITGSLLVAAPPCIPAYSLGLGVLPEHSAADTSNWAAPPSPRKSEY